MSRPMKDGPRAGATGTTHSGALGPDRTLDCGAGVEDLDAYLSRGRRPAEPSYERCPECRAALDALENLRSLSPALLAQDVDLHDHDHEGWLDDMLTSIAVEARAGRTHPVGTPDPGLTLGQTEGSLLALVRSAGDDVDGTLLGRCRIIGDLEQSVGTTAVEVSVEVSVIVFWHGQALDDLAERIRAGVLADLQHHTDLTITAIDIVIADLILTTGATDER